MPHDIVMISKKIIMKLVRRSIIPALTPDEEFNILFEHLYTQLTLMRIYIMKRRLSSREETTHNTMARAVYKFFADFINSEQRLIRVILFLASILLVSKKERKREKRLVASPSLLLSDNNDNSPTIELEDNPIIVLPMKPHR